MTRNIGRPTYMSEYTLLLISNDSNLQEYSLSREDTSVTRFYSLQPTGQFVQASSIICSVYGITLFSPYSVESVGFPYLALCPCLDVSYAFVPRA